MNTLLMPKVIESQNLMVAWKQVKENKGSAGVDGISIKEYAVSGRKKWPKIRKGLLEGNYIPSPVLRVEIPKKSGGVRKLGIPTVRDRLIQQAISEVITPIFDPDFSEHSFGFRPQRSAHQAIRQMQNYVCQGYSWVVDLDLEKFFDNVNHDILMSEVGKKIRDKTLLKLIGRYLRAGVVIKGQTFRTPKGTPQGGPISPLLGNIILDKLDKYLESNGFLFCRYADDLRLFTKTKAEATEVMEQTIWFLEHKLKLKVNREKSKLSKAGDSSFLGFTLKGRKLRWTEESYSTFRYTLRKLTARSSGISFKTRLHRINVYLRGWMNYYGISQYYTPIDSLDGWIRRRLRMCLWKQWRYVRTRVSNLLKLGVPKKMAIDTGRSSKCFWRLSKTYGTNFGMSNSWFEKQGLLSAKTLWCKAQGYIQ